MKRLTIRLALLLLAGAIFNVAVAWSFCLLPHGKSQQSDWTPNEDDVEWWRHNAPSGWTDQPAGVSEFKSIGRYSLFMHSKEWTEGVRRTLGNNGSRSMRGWPCLSLEWLIWVDHDTRTTHVRDSFTLPQQWPFPTSRWVQLPLKPLPLGFAINTIFYAAVLWMLFAAPFKVRRWRRIKRGQCASCGYSLRGTPENEKCPECGTFRQP